MGNYLPPPLNTFGQREDVVENIEDAAGNTYRYPPKSGTYFSQGFVMAGTKFENMNTEAFLFGENNDLNYVSNKPVQFPYHMPDLNEPSHTIKCLMHLRKDTLRLIREEQGAGKEPTTGYRVEFKFDADVRCSVKIFMMAREDVSSGSAVYTPRKPELASEKTHFNKGSNQAYSSPNFIFTPDEFQPSELNYIPGSPEIPFVIQISAEGTDYPGHSESTLAGIEKLSDGAYKIKFMKQKIMVDGFSLMIQELYGIENRNTRPKNEDDDDDSDDDTMLCDICMTNLKDTLILPCRHLCLCSQCAATMKNKQSKCPICRANFHALLRIVGVRKKNQHGNNDEKYEEVPLIKAFSGNYNSECEKEAEFNSRSSGRSSRRSLRARLGSNRSLKKAAAALQSTFTDSDGKTENLKREQKKAGHARTSPSPIEPDLNRDPVQMNEESGIPLTEMIRTTSLEVAEEEEVSQDDPHLDASLPGTPMDYVSQSPFRNSSSRESSLSASKTHVVVTPSPRSASVGLRRSEDMESGADQETI